MFHRTIAACIAAFALAAPALGATTRASKDLKIIAIDVEGGAAVLFKRVIIGISRLTDH